MQHCQRTFLDVIIIESEESLSTHMPDYLRLRLILWQHSKSNMIAK